MVDIAGGRRDGDTAPSTGDIAGGAVYLIGPSSVGKSYLAEEVARRLSLPCPNIDHDLGGERGGYEPLRDWTRVLPWLESIDRFPCLAPIGAGTQASCLSELIAYLEPRRHRTVLIMDDPEAVFGRNVAAGHNPPDAFTHYKALEFDAREPLYALAGNVIDYRVTLMGGDAATELVGIVEDLSR